MLSLISNFDLNPEVAILLPEVLKGLDLLVTSTFEHYSDSLTFASSWGEHPESSSLHWMEQVGSEVDDWTHCCTLLCYHVATLVDGDKLLFNLTIARAIARPAAASGVVPPPGWVPRINPQPLRGLVGVLGPHPVLSPDCWWHHVCCISVRPPTIPVA